MMKHFPPSSLARFYKAACVEPQPFALPEGRRSDGDVVVVTKLSEEEYTPEQAMNVFVPFLEKHYKGKWTFQGRSIGIELSYADLDLVITSAPSESEIGILESNAATADESPDEVDDWRLVRSWIPLANRTSTNARWLLEAARKEAEWRLSPLRIPDREAQRWEPTILLPRFNGHGTRTDNATATT